jgi:bifunctional non-homologous end joining protein LigD
VISHPEKVLFPDDGITKAELAGYYESIAPVMLPHIIGRPVTMERYHRGIGEKGFIQKSVTKGFPEWLERVEVPKKGGTVHHPVVRDVRGLVWLANQNCITPHVWASRVPHLYHPDVCILDLDPSDDDASRLRDGACLVRDLLKELGLASWVKTSGSKGYHIAVPLDGGADAGDVSRFAGEMGRVLVERHGALFTMEFAKADRGDRIYIDVGRNHPPATFAAVYAVRPKPGAPVSAPCTWEEVESGAIGPRSLTLRAMAERVAAVGDLWSDMLKSPVSLPASLRR